MTVDHSSLNAKVLEIAREWIGTPYLHQAALKHVGCDCLGLLRGIWAELYDTDVPSAPPYTPEWAEVGTPNSSEREPMLSAAHQYLYPVMRADVMVGDILFVRPNPRGAVKHCGVISALSPLKIIHAYSEHAVREDPVHRTWLRRDTYYFRFKDTI